MPKISEHTGGTGEIWIEFSEILGAPGPKVLYLDDNGTAMKDDTFSTLQLAVLLERAAQASFAAGLLAVDEPLWGGFWHGDVIGPGYSLPVAEVALLRAVRLDGTWPATTTLSRFLADLQAAARHPQAGVWTLTVAGEPCLIVAAPVHRLLTVVWYNLSTGRLHAGYRAAPAALPLPGAVTQRQPQFGKLLPLPPPLVPGWLSHGETANSSSPVARLDRAILQIRALTAP